MKNTSKENLLAFIRGPFRSTHALSSSATTWLSVELGLQQLNDKVRFWLRSEGPSEKVKTALAALRATSDEEITSVLAECAKADAAAWEREEARRVAEQVAWDAKWAAMSEQDKAEFIADAEAEAAQVEREEEHGSTKTLPRGWSISSDGRTLNQFGDEV